VTEIYLHFATLARFIHYDTRSRYHNVRLAKASKGHQYFDHGSADLASWRTARDAAGIHVVRRPLPFSSARDQQKARAPRGEGFDLEFAFGSTQPTRGGLSQPAQRP
jgi:hypothetical protein